MDRAEKSSKSEELAGGRADCLCDAARRTRLAR